MNKLTEKELTFTIYALLDAWVSQYAYITKAQKLKFIKGLINLLKSLKQIDIRSER